MAWCEARFNNYGYRNGRRIPLPGPRPHRLRHADRGHLRRGRPEPPGLHRQGQRHPGGLPGVGSGPGARLRRGRPAGLPAYPSHPLVREFLHRRHRQPARQRARPDAVRSTWTGRPGRGHPGQPERPGVPALAGPGRRRRGLARRDQSAPLAPARPRRRAASTSSYGGGLVSLSVRADLADQCTEICRGRLGRGRQGRHRRDRRRLGAGQRTRQRHLGLVDPRHARSATARRRSSGPLRSPATTPGRAGQGRLPRTGPPLRLRHRPDRRDRADEGGQPGQPLRPGGHLRRHATTSAGPGTSSTWPRATAPSSTWNARGSEPRQ